MSRSTIDDVIASELSAAKRLRGLELEVAGIDEEASRIMDRMRAVDEMQKVNKGEDECPRRS